VAGSAATVRSGPVKFGGAPDIVEIFIAATRAGAVDAGLAGSRTGVQRSAHDEY